MDVRKDCGDRTYLAPRQFGTPGTRIEMFEHKLVHSIVYGVTLHQCLAKIAGNGGLRAGHGISCHDERYPRAPMPINERRYNATCLRLITLINAVGFIYFLSSLGKSAIRIVGGRQIRLLD